MEARVNWTRVCLGSCLTGCQVSSASVAQTGWHDICTNFLYARARTNDREPPSPTSKKPGYDAGRRYVREFLFENGCVEDLV